MAGRKQSAGMKYTWLSVGACVAVLLGLDLTNPEMKILENLMDFLSQGEQIEADDYEIGDVVRIVDGDTIVVEIDGEEEKIRFIGVDTPESVGKYANNPQAYGKEASIFTENLLEDTVVYLEADAGNEDRFGRALRYVWIEEPDYSRMSEIMVNAMLIEEGLAECLFIEPNTRYQEEFEEIESRVKEEEIGIWSEQ